MNWNRSGRFSATTCMDAGSAENAGAIFCHSVHGDKKEVVLSKQVLSSGTAIGALIREAEFAQSKADVVSKMCISLKEANETEYLFLLKDTALINEKQFSSIYHECKELIAMLVSTVNASKP